MLLKSSPHTIGWHSLGMEWKEHVAWLVPISITMAAPSLSAMAATSGASRNCAPRCFALLDFVSCRGHSRFLRRMLVKNAPVEGGRVIHLMHGE